MPITTAGANGSSDFSQKCATGAVISACLNRNVGDDIATADGGIRTLAVDVLLGRVVLLVDRLGSNTTLSVTPKRARSGVDAPDSIMIHVMLESALHARVWSALERHYTKGDLMIRLGRVSVRDPLQGLVCILLSASPDNSSVQELYSQSLALMLTARLFTENTRSADSNGTRCVPPMPKWRLRRVADYVEANLAKSITLADLAKVGGLTPMYFAAQFRATVGVRPHDYILQMRVEKAQERLVMTADRLVDIALDVGFQTQAHFTTVFKRFVGTPPHQWREIARGRREAA